MGSFQSSQHGRDSREDDGGGVVTEQEHDIDVGGSVSSTVAGESCATIEHKSEEHAVNNETKSREPCEDSNSDTCDAGEKCRELAEFREELGKKRELRKTKMAEIKQEMDQLRKGLAEEKAKNRALIRFIQQNQEQTKGSTEAKTCGVEEIATIVNEPMEACHNDTENLPEQSDSGPHSAAITTTTPPDDLRLGLKRDLAESQLQLQQANGEILSLQSVIDQLRTQVQSLQTPSEEEEAARTARNKEFRHLQAELADAQFQLQIANAEVLSLQSDITQLKNHVKGLKDVIKAGKEIIHIREDQVEQLKAKLRQIEDSLHERELHIMSTDLRREYERQMANIRNLRELYEERERVSRMERDNLLRQLELRKNDLEAEQEKNKNLESHVASLQTDLETMKNELVQTQENLSQSTVSSQQLHAEMTVVNQFISKFLLGMNRKQTTNSVKLDKLTEVLAENRGLLIDMAKEESETIDLGAFLPRALYDLVAEVDEEPTETDGSECSEEDGAFSEMQTASPEQIADKLPKVWRVLIELVNHQERVQQVPFVENGESEECLKQEPTKNGSKTVVSVSKTYLKLKDLILEKKALKKETNRLKTLNTHLERRLETQEKRLSAVSLELTKTWHLVGKMQRQHRQLHTQEQILRYHLQQKRRLLSELKEELEYCRLKWSAARQKNIESEDQWKILKADFVARKKQDSLNNSGESGYSDEQPTDDDEDEDYRREEKPSKKHLSRMVNFERYRSASLTNVLQVALEMRKCHSESDMKSLRNVERANQFCNEKIEDLPIFPEEEVACSVKKKAKKSKKRKDKRSGPETAEDMFRRLAGLDRDSNEEEEDDEDLEDDISEDSECSEIEKIEQRESSPVKEAELSSEELFNMKREARLKRMAELNSRLDTYSSPNAVKEPETGVSEADSAEAGPSTVLTNTEEDYLQRRAARLERLEREAREFRNRLSRTVDRGTAISAQIDEIHNGFIARQSESPVPGSSSENRPATPKSNDTSATDLAVLSDREREYTQNRSDRLQSLENQSQSLLQQMNRTLKRGSRLTTQLDMLHSRYGSNEQTDSNTSTNVTPSTNDQPDVSTSPVQNVEQNALPEPATIDTILLENSIAIPANGPLELILVSDEEILEEVDELLPTPSNATSVQEDAHADSDRDASADE